MKQLDLDLKIERNLNPEGGALTPISREDEEGVYPTAHYEGPEELDLPPHGTMVVHYRVLREEEIKLPQKPEGHDHWYRCDIQLRRIISAEAEKDIRPSKRDTSAEDNLDSLMRNAQSDEGEE